MKSTAVNIGKQHFFLGDMIQPMTQALVLEMSRILGFTRQDDVCLVTPCHRLGVSPAFGFTNSCCKFEGCPGQWDCDVGISWLGHHHPGPPDPSRYQSWVLGNLRLTFFPPRFKCGVRPQGTATLGLGAPWCGGAPVSGPTLISVPFSLRGPHFVPLSASEVCPTCRFGAISGSPQALFQIWVPGVSMLLGSGAVF